MVVKPQYKVRFAGSFTSLKDMPRTAKPEFAFIGRSNVGKSSLINMLMGQNIAKTSAKPGKTQTINLFNVEDRWYLADLPGYGYAKTAKTRRQQWQRMISEYLLRRPELTNVFVLIDIRHEPQPIDYDFIRWSGENQLPIAIVFTKADKVSKNELKRTVTQWQKLLSTEWEELPEMFISSAKTKLGREDLLNFIHETLKQIDLSSHKY